jgi:hypothetical protein
MRESIGLLLSFVDAGRADGERKSWQKSCWHRWGRVLQERAVNANSKPRRPARRAGR